MKLSLLSIIPGLFIFFTSYSQPSFRSYETRSAGVSVNLHWMQLSDALFSPLRYNGPGGEIKIVSARDYDDMRRHFSLGAKVDYIWNNLDFHTMYLQPGFHYGLSFLVNDLSTERTLSYLGGGMTGTSRIYNFLNEDPDHIYWTTSYTVDFNYFLDINIGQGKKIFAELTLPLAGVVSRPSEENLYSFQLPGFWEHTKRLHENIGFATLDKMQSANMIIAMDLTRTRRHSFSIGYEVDFSRFTDPRPVIYFSNSLYLRLLFNALVW